MKEALLYISGKNNSVVCNLCRHFCRIENGRRGICGVRENRNGQLFSLVYGKLIAEHVDPVEKKPLFHVLPGSLTYSIATAGCNFRCTFCQNSDISQISQLDSATIPGRYTEPEEVVKRALESRCNSIAYTYTEPTIFFEYALDTAVIAREKGLKNIFVSNGYMSEKAVEAVAPVLDAANIDLKAFSDAFYKKYCGARLEHVTENLKYLKSKGVFLEITTLLITDLNDNPDELRELARFIVKELGPETPWHISRFHPTYNMTDRGPTPEDRLDAAVRTGVNEGLAHVYVGNVYGHSGENTNCPSCGKTVIVRKRYQIIENRMSKDKCSFCNTVINGVFN